MILDIGCGTGANAFWIKDQGQNYPVWAIDASQHAIDRVNEEIAKRGTWFSVKKAVATSLPFWSDQDGDGFNAVIDCCTLQHVENVEKALSEIHRVLRPGGWLFSIMATIMHHMKPFPAGMFTRFLTDAPSDAKKLFLNASFDVPWMGVSEYEDEEYGNISHWLIHARKP